VGAGVSSDPIDVIERAAGYCARLAAVEHAHILDDEQEISTLLDGVDPIDARLCANTLRVLATTLRGVTTGAGGFPPSPTTSDSDQASAPNYPEVTHIGDNWSRKVTPCA